MSFLAIEMGLSLVSFLIELEKVFVCFTESLFVSLKVFVCFTDFFFDQLDLVLLTSFQSLGLLFLCFLTYLFEVQLQNYGFFFHYKYSNL